MPLLGWRIFFTDLANLVRKLFFEIGVCDKQIIKKFFDDRLDILRIRNLVQ